MQVMKTRIPLINLDKFCKWVTLCPKNKLIFTTDVSTKSKTSEVMSVIRLPDSSGVSKCKSGVWSSVQSGTMINGFH